MADQLEDGRVLSGVGGQYNFVAQGHALDGARSILILRSWRESAGEVSSKYCLGVRPLHHSPAPAGYRHYRVRALPTCAGKTDAKVIEALLNITDSRFQGDLIEQAQKAGKLPKDFQLDPRFADNTPERLQAIQAKHRRLFPEYPLGSDFTDEERDLLRALNWLKSKFKLTEILELARRHWMHRSRRRIPSIWYGCVWISRRGLKEDLYQRLLLAGLQATAR